MHYDDTCAARMVVLLALSILCVGSVYAETFSVVSFNTGLTSWVDHYKQRREAIGPAIRELNGDVVCLQEVWFSKDMNKILRLVNETEYPYSYSDLHNEVGMMSQVSGIESPCGSMDVIAKFLPCIDISCRNPENQLQYLKCAKKCGLSKLEQSCITCLILSDSKTALDSCVFNPGNRFNIPGLLLLSKRPLSNPEVTYFVPNKKLLIPRAYIAAEVYDIGKIICTHTSANLGKVYYEDLPFDSWAAQDKAEAQMLALLLQSSPRGIIMGDLNGGPAVSHSDVTADFADAYTSLLDSGLRPAYVESLGICTWCVYNPLTKSHHNSILDHVFVKNVTVLGAMRIFDSNILGKKFPLSDHYGVQVILDV